MHRVTGATLSAVGIGLVAVFLVAGFVLGGIPLAGHASTGGPTTAPAAKPVAATPTVAGGRSYVPIIVVTLLTSVPAFVAVPFTFSYDVNMSWGSIDNTHTNGTVVINWANNASDVWKTFYITGTVDTSKVQNYVLNGIPYANYVWNFTLGKATLGCTTASCAGTIPNNDSAYNVTLYVSESAGSDWGASAALPNAVTTSLVVTFVSASFVTPTAITDMADINFGMAYVPVGTIVTIATNISWGWTGNSSTNMTVAITNATGANLWVVSFNGTVNATMKNVAGVYVSSSLGFNGSVQGVWYSAATWTFTLNESTLNAFSAGCTTPSCANKLGSEDVMLAITANETGTAAGGNVTGYSVAEAGLAAQPSLFGSTLLDASESTFAVPFQPLPFGLSGTLTLSWAASNLTLLAPSSATKTSPGNVSVAGSYFSLTYTNNSTTDGSLAGKLFGTFSIANSVNTTNAYGVSLIPVASQTYVAGKDIPYNLTTYTWSIMLNTSYAGWSSTTVPYLDFNLTATLEGNGNATGIWGNETTVVAPPNFEYQVLAEFPTTAAAAWVSTLPGYVNIPYTQNFTITVTNAQIDPTTTTVLVNVTDLTAADTLLSSTPMTVTPGQTAYSFTITSTVLSCLLPSCLGFSPSPTDVFSLSVFVGVNGIGYPAGPGATNGTLAQGGIASSFYAITVPLSATLSPGPAAALTPGNVTLTVVFSGTFVETVNLGVYSPTGALVFSQAFASSGNNATWLVTSPGVYKASIAVVTAYPNPTSTKTFFNSTLTVLKIPKIYVNSTSYSNSTLIPGLSAGGAGTLLLILGLIIGMVVALLLGRAVWGGRPSPTPPQAWESQTAAGAGAGAAAGGTTGAAAGTNTCSVCGKSFATPEELAAHQKSEHGME